MKFTIYFSLRLFSYKLCKACFATATKIECISELCGDHTQNISRENMLWDFARSLLHSALNHWTGKFSILAKSLLVRAQHIVTILSIGAIDSPGLVDDK